MSIKKQGNDSFISKKQLIEFYNNLIREGRVSPDGAAYKRWEKLSENTLEDKRKRLNEFLLKRNKKKED